MIFNYIKLTYYKSRKAPHPQIQKELWDNEQLFGDMFFTGKYSSEENYKF